MIFGVCSDIGKIRTVNQDLYYNSECKELPLFVVADGMGGHNGGETASYLAIKTIKEMINKHKEELINKEIQIPKFIQDVFKEANSVIYKEGNNNKILYGMGTTLTAIYFSEKSAIIGHVGDSRAYLLKDNKLIQLTQDHSLVAELVKNGSISSEEAKNHPQKHVITRALGTNKHLKFDMFEREIEIGDTYMLCSDGLTNMLDDEEIKKVLSTINDPQEMCDCLIEKANQHGGDDNITVLTIKID
ncbi:Stp1/IreP family PP2C-type Ser/Thr phosphatase [Clostridiaceae bacterium M8S5]|nr:Stp1/IreP family PP2C-type Ser/Thr phosphatase [Clostridiaceae bacterium M8S5]